MAGDWGAIPVYATLDLDVRDPHELFTVLKGRSKHCFLLESREDAEGWGRYTFLGFDPILELTCKDGQVRVTAQTSFEVAATHPKQVLRDVLHTCRSPRLDGLPPFTGGLVGYFAYDYLKYSEPTLSLCARDEEGFMDVDLMLFDKVIAYDRLAGVLYLIATVRTDALEANYRRAADELAALALLVREGCPLQPDPLRLGGPFEPLFDEPVYHAMVEAVLEHIRDGDIFQAVLSNRLVAPGRGSLYSAYRLLAHANPSPYLFYLSSDQIELVGASPETLVRLNGTQASTFPLAGTRPRGRTPEEDALLEAELLADAKELAEHDMLVDLGRNDLGRISELGSVSVEGYRTVERFSHVMHLASTVRSTVRPGIDALDLVDAVLPAGTLSGAPKLRACEIIDRLEGNRRGVYGGAVGYLGFNGDMDLCIAIRLAYMRGGRVFVRAGAGIVSDSVAAQEHLECRSKMQAVLDALEAANASGGESL
jgi:anthranilate synthase component 1